MVSYERLGKISIHTFVWGAVLDDALLMANGTLLECLRRQGASHGGRYL